MPDAEAPTLLQQTPFVRFWMARVSGILSNQMLMLAVAWQMYDLTSSAWDLGLVGLFQFVPALLMTLPAGHLADRLHRARIFAACMATQAAVALVLLVSTEFSWTTRELILALSVVLGMVRAFQMPAQQALTPLLVPPSLLQRAISVGSVGMQIAIVGGPALGGLLYGAGPATVYGACLGLSLVSAAFTSTVHYHHIPAQRAATLASVFAGVAFVWRRQVLMGAISLDLFAVLLGGATALLPIYARDILHTGPQGLGLLRAAPALGALLMTLVLVRFPLQRHAGYKLLGAVGVFGLATLVFGVSTHFGLSMLALAVTGAADSISVVTRQTLMQLDTPDEMRGRVSAVNSIFIGASNQLGEFESGATAALWGPVGSVVVGGLGTLVIALAWLRLFPDLAKRDRLSS
jgi:MFS family permease